MKFPSPVTIATVHDATCEIDSAKALRLEVPGLTASKSATSAVHRITPSTLTPFGAGCRIWRPE